MTIVGLELNPRDFNPELLIGTQTPGSGRMEVIHLSADRPLGANQIGHFSSAVRQRWTQRQDNDKQNLTEHKICLGRRGPGKSEADS